MGTHWLADKHRADRFEPEIKRILGEHLITTADARRDQHEATDLMLLELAPFRIGCRVRSFDYLTRYPQQFTIRAGRPSGAESEIAKIIRGWGDYLFYGFADAQDAALAAWIIGDLSIFRDTLIRKPALLRHAKFQQKNGDHSSTFYAWPLAEFPQNFVFARSAT
jgi:hypothetical protein